MGKNINSHNLTNEEAIILLEKALTVCNPPQHGFVYIVFINIFIP